MKLPTSCLYRLRRYLDHRDISSCKVVSKIWYRSFSLWTHPRDTSLEFHEYTHRYRVSKIEYTSVTTFIHSLFPKFNPDRAVVCLKGGRKWNPDHKDWGKSDEEIKESWRKNGEEQAKLGTAMHAYLEEYFNSCLVKQSPSSPFPDPNILKSDHFGAFIHDHSHLSPYRFEWTIFSEKIKIAGTVDALFWNPRDQVPGQPPRVFLFDWKRSKQIEVYNRYEFGFGPVSHVSKCNFETYSIQLNLYTWMLEKHYGVTVIGMALIVFHPNNTNYLKYEVQRKTELIGEIIKYRKVELSRMS